MIGNVTSSSFFEGNSVGVRDLFNRQVSDNNAIADSANIYNIPKTNDSSINDYPQNITMQGQLPNSAGSRLNVLA